MKRLRHGFTLVEVSLFLAITGVLFVGIVAGVQNSMFQQRYNDSVQSFAEFLRSIYSQTSNVQNPRANGGQSTEKAIYGRLVVFGESKDLEGNDAKDGAIFAYDVIGNVSGTYSGEVKTALQSLALNVFVTKTNPTDDSVEYEFAGNVEEYKPRWGAGIQTTSDIFGENSFKGAILVVRHPRSGSIFTLVKEGETLNINDEELRKNALENLAELKGFEVGSRVDFCVNPNGNLPSDARRDIRIIQNARNASGVEIINLDDDVNNECNKK